MEASAWPMSDAVYPVMVLLALAGAGAGWLYHRWRLRRLREELEREKRTCLRSARHDLLSPLNAVSGYLELLEEHSADWSEAERSFLRKARSAFQRTMEVLDTLRQR